MQEAPTQPVRKLRLFLCHSSVDKPAVRNFYRRLQNDKFDPWLDEESLLPGQDWEHEIKKAVRAADVVLVCLSRVSVERTGFANKEIKFALDVADEKPEETIFIIPVKLEECVVPDRLQRWHWVNLFEERGYEKLLRALQELANKLGATIPPTLPVQFFYTPSASAILITPDARDIYCTDEERGRIIVIENIPHAGGGLKTKDIIDLNRSGSAAHPQRLALNPGTNTLYVTDPPSDEVIVIDRGHNNAIVNRIPVGRLPRSIVFTPNGDKAYVSNEGPIPQGTISIIDARQHRTVGTIRGVNTPEGLAIDPANHRVYIASQSGYGEDPVFVIDTAEDRILERETIEKMAVGVAVAVSVKHRKLYVARGNFPYAGPLGDQASSPFSVVDLNSHRVLKTHALRTSVNLVVLTPNEDYALVGNSDHISIVDTSSDLIVKEFRFESPPIGIAVSQENAVYVLLSGFQIKLLGLSGLPRPRQSLADSASEIPRNSELQSALSGPGRAPRNSRQLWWYTVFSFLVAAVLGITFLVWGRKPVARTTSADALPSPTLPRTEKQRIASPKTAPQLTAAGARLTVMCDLNCTWSLDGQSQTRVEAGGSNSIVASPGKHVLMATTDTDPSIRDVRNVTITANESNKVDFDLLPIQQKRDKQVADGIQRAQELANKVPGKYEAALDEIEHILRLTPRNQTAIALRRKILRECSGFIPNRCGPKYGGQP